MLRSFSLGVKMANDQSLRQTELEHMRLALALSSNDVSTLLSGLGNDEIGDDTRFENYCTLCSFHRRNRNVSEYFRLTVQFDDEFKAEPLHRLHKAIAHHDRGLNNDVDTSLEITESLLREHPEFVGALHFMAVIMMSKYKETKDEKWLKKALGNVDQAIANSPEYAKFYETRSKIYSQLGKLDRALENIAVAIDKEDSSSSDYAIRLSGYFSTKTDIEVRSYLVGVEQRVNAIEDNAQKKNLEILSFFIVLATFLIGSFSLVNALNFQEVVQIIFVLGSMNLIVCSGFLLFFFNENRVGRVLWVSGVACVLLVLAYLTPMVFVGR